MLADGSVVEYDVLIVATGSTRLPEETEGLLGRGWNRDGRSVPRLVPVQR